MSYTAALITIDQKRPQSYYRYQSAAASQLTPSAGTAEPSNFPASEYAKYQEYAQPHRTAVGMQQAAVDRLRRSLLKLRDDLAGPGGSSSAQQSPPRAAKSRRHITAIG